MTHRAHLFNEPEHKQQTVSHTGALNLLLNSQDVCSEIFPMVYCGNKTLLTVGLHWGSRVGLFRVDLEWHSKMIGGISVSEGPHDLSLSTRGKVLCERNSKQNNALMDKM